MLNEINNSGKFAEWLNANRWYTFIDGKWHYTFEHGTIISDAQYKKNYVKTTEELYLKFLEEQGVKIESSDENITLSKKEFETFLKDWDQGYGSWNESSKRIVNFLGLVETNGL